MSHDNNMNTNIVGDTGQDPGEPDNEHDQMSHPGTDADVPSSPPRGNPKPAFPFARRRPDGPLYLPAASSVQAVSSRWNFRNPVPRYQERG